MHEITKFWAKRRYPNKVQDWMKFAFYALAILIAVALGFALENGLLFN